MKSLGCFMFCIDKYCTKGYGWIVVLLYFVRPYLPPQKSLLKTSVKRKLHNTSKALTARMQINGKTDKLHRVQTTHQRLRKGANTFSQHCACASLAEGLKWIHHKEACGVLVLDCSTICCYYQYQGSAEAFTLIKFIPLIHSRSSPVVSWLYNMGIKWCKSTHGLFDFE